MKLLSFYSTLSTPPKTDQIPSSLLSASHPYLLLSTGVLHYPTQSLIPLNSIKQIASNGFLCLSVTFSGQVFGWGNDPEGLLCKGPLQTSSPISLSSLSSISEVSVSQNHAAAISTDGKLFTWGSKAENKLGDTVFEENSPKIVPSCGIYEAVSVICGLNYTGIVTAGGYLMVYGQISSNHMPQLSTHKSVSKKKEALPYSNPKLDSSSVLKVIGTDSFIVAVLETFEVVVFDGCFNLTKFSVPETGFDSIHANSNSIIGVNMTEVVIWERSEAGCKFECPIKNWKPEKFKAVENFMIWTWGEEILVASDKVEVFEEDANVDEYLPVVEKSLRKSWADSPLVQVKNFISPQVRKESLLRLFPGGQGEKVIEKIMKVQEEFSNRSLVKDVFKKIVYPVVKDAFFVVKEFVKKKRIFEGFRNVCRIFCVCENILGKKVSNRFFLWKRNFMIAEVKERMMKKIERFGKKGIGRKIEMFCGRVQVAVENVKLRICGEVVFLVWRMMNKEKCVKFIGRKLSNRWVFEYFDKWRKVYMSKFVFVKRFEEKSFFCANNWLSKIFFILLQEYQRKEIFSAKVQKGVNKFHIFLKKLKRKLGFVKFKSVLFINKSNKLKRQVLLTRLCHTLLILFRSHLKSSIQNTFTSLKHFKKPSPPKSSSKIFFSTNRLLKSQASHKPKLNSLYLFLNHHLKSHFNHLLLISQDSFHSNFYSFLFSLNKFLTQKRFLYKLTSLTSIKLHTDSHQTFNELLASYSNTQNLLEEMSNLKATDSSQLSLFEGSYKSKEANSLFFDTSKMILNKNPTFFRNGELMSFQKYLINKRKLEMIKEDACEGGNFYIDKKIDGKKVRKGEKPPWKPASASTNFCFQVKKESAVEKGMKYYEARVQKQVKSRSSVNLSKLNESALEIFLKNKRRSKGPDELESRYSMSPLLYTLENEFTSPIMERLSNKLFGFVIVGKMLRLFGARCKFKAFRCLKNIKKMKKIDKSQQKQLDSHAKLLQQTKLLVQPSTWQLRMINIGFEKFKKFITAKHKAIFTEFKRLINSE